MLFYGKCPRQGCTTQKSELAMHQNHQFQYQAIKKSNHRVLEVGGRGGSLWIILAVFPWANAWNLGKPAPVNSEQLQGRNWRNPYQIWPCRLSNKEGMIRMRRGLNRPEMGMLSFSRFQAYGKNSGAWYREPFCHQRGPYQTLQAEHRWT